MSKRVKITQKIIDNHPRPTDGKTIVLRDSEVIGLTVHIGIDLITFRLEKMINGIRINEKISDGVTKVADARNLASELIVKKRAARYIKLVKANIAQALEEYIFPKLEVGLKDSKSAKSCLNLFLRKFFGGRQPESVTHVEAQNAVVSEIDAGLAPETIRKRVLGAKKSYKTFIKLGLATHNPFEDIERPKVSNIRDVTLSPEQRPDWFKCCIAENSVGAEAVLIQFLQALRVDEAISIKVSDISADFKTLKLPETKSRKTQYVATCSLVQELLKRRVSNTWNQFVFPSEKHTDRHITSPRGAFNRIKKRMTVLGHDISTLTQHDLRRTNSSACAEVTGGDVHMVAKHIRHSNPSILHRYVHYQSDAVAAVSEATAQALINPKLTEEK